MRRVRVGRARAGLGGGGCSVPVRRSRVLARPGGALGVLAAAIFACACTAPGRGSTDAGPAASAVASARSASWVARVGPRTVSARFFRDLLDKAQRAPDFGGRRAALEARIDLMIFSREADARGVPVSYESQQLERRDARVFYREFLEVRGHRMDTLRARFPIVVKLPATEAAHALALMPEEGEAGFAESPAGRELVLTVGAEPCTLGCAAGYLMTQDRAAMATAPDAERERLLRRVAEDRLLEQAFAAERVHDADFADECLGHLHDRYRAQDLFRSLGAAGIHGHTHDATTVIAVSEAEILAFHAAHADEFRKPVSARARHIRVRTREEAERLEQLVKSGSDFAALARANSLAPDAPRGGDVGVVPANDSVGPPLNHVFLVAPGRTAVFVFGDDHAELIQTLSLETAVQSPTDPGVAYDIRRRVAQVKREAMLDALRRRGRSELGVEIDDAALEALR